MPLHHEPPDGDYAAYIRKLAQQPPPGKVDKPASRRKPQRPFKVLRHDYNSHTEFEHVPIDDDKAPDSLGPEGSPRLLGRVQMVLGILSLLVLVRMLTGMLDSPDPFTPGNLVPVILLAFIVRMFFVRASRKLREAKNRGRKADQPSTPRR